MVFEWANINGWQRIQRIDGNNSIAFGHQIFYKPNSKIILNSSSFIGNDKPDSTKQMRYFHNLYGIIQVHKKIGITFGFDFGAEQKSNSSNGYNNWFTPVLLVKYMPNTRHNIAARAEYYNDKNGVIISTKTPNGFKTWGYSINYDFLIQENVLWRAECRGFSGSDKTFTKEGNATSTNFFITTSLAIWL